MPLGGRLPMAGLVLILLVGLELKHYIADYLLQPRWLIFGKGDLRAHGGYLHAGIHVLGSAVVLFVATVPGLVLLLLCTLEFVVHYLIDFAKDRLARGLQAEHAPWAYWAVHGLDQLLHQLTYAMMVFVALLAFG